MPNCPSCNQPVKPLNSSSQLLQCSCGKVLVLDSTGGVTVSRYHSPVSDTPAYLKPGDTGTYKKEKFTLTGRAVAISDDSVYNYWQIVFENKEQAILSEGYGHYAVLTLTTQAPDMHLEVLQAMTTGLKTIFCNDKKYRLTRKKIYSSFQVEGETSWPDSNGGFRSYELFNEGGDSLEVIDFGKGVPFIYKAAFFLPQELQLSHTGSAPPARQVKCDSCKTLHSVVAFPYTYSFNCVKCATTHTYNRVSKRFQKNGNYKQIPYPYIEIGSVGTLDGIEFKVIGMASKQERNADAAVWKEYTLYNPIQGFAYLSEFQGNWVYVKEWPRPPLITRKGKDYFTENGNEFELFNDYSYKVLAAAGEHIYDLDKTGNVKVTEFICPPQTLIQEMTPAEETWFFGEHLERTDVQKNFVMPVGMPDKHGIGSVEPAGMINKTHFFLTLLAGIVAICVLHFLLVQHKEERVLYNEQVLFPDSLHTVSGVTPHFTLEKSESNLQLELHTSISNSWLEAEGSFVNAKTGKEYPFNKVVEFYEGFEDGERWTEGNIDEDKVVTGIPAGEYYMDYKAVQDSTTSPMSTYINPSTAGKPFYMKLVYDVPIHSNMFFSAGLVLLVGLILYASFYYIDKKRWYNSKYSKYNYEDQ